MSKKFKQICALALSGVLAFSSLVVVPQGVLAQAAENAPKVVGSIEVCKILVNEEGSVIDGKGLNSTFSIDFDGPESGESVVFVPEILEDLTEDIVNDNDDADDAVCRTLNNLPLGTYTYEAEEISDDEAWGTPKYHDYFDGEPESLSDFLELTVDGSEADNDNADGVINLTENKPNRRLVIVNTLLDEIGSRDPAATIIAHKIVCKTEEDLPNWGDHNEVTKIDESTAEKFVNKSEGSCWFEEGFDFQWAPGNTSINYTGQSNQGDLGSPWETFSPTDSDGKATLTLTAEELDNQSHIWIHEVWSDDYIPFTGQNTDQNVSAEIYCHTDVLNYDNFERVDGISVDNTYYCVAFNVEVAPEIESCEPIVVVSDLNDTVEATANNVVATYDDHPSWTAAILDAIWIWDTFQVQNPTQDETKTFTKTFDVDFEVDSAVLEVAADNSYKVWINGEFVGEDNTEFNYKAPTDIYDTTVVDALKAGENTIKFEVKNWQQNGGTYTSNPAGLLYRLEVTPETNEDGSCIPTEPEEEPKIPVCDNPEVNLVENGDFESPVVNHAAKWEIFKSGTATLDWIVEWVRTGGEGRPEVASIEFHKGVNGWTSKSGQQHVELDSDWQGPGVGGSEDASVAIYQDIETVPGLDYKLEFFFSPRPSTSQDENILNIGWGGSQVATLGPIAGVANTDWSKHTYTLTATTTITRLVFSDGGVGNSEGTFLDAVTLSCISEDEPTIAGCYVGGYKYDTEGNPLSGWEINLGKFGQCEAGAEWADNVVSFVQGKQKNGGDIVVGRSGATKALGEAENDDTENFVSLGFGGELVLEFDNVIWNGAGDDIQVYETSFGSPDFEDYQEKIDVYASQNGIDWTLLGEIRQGDLETVDLGDLVWAKFVKIVDTSDPSEFGATDDGFDLDAVKALHCRETLDYETEVTDDTGYYCFSTDEYDFEGEYVVFETLQTGWGFDHLTVNGSELEVNLAEIKLPDEPEESIVIDFYNVEDEGGDGGPDNEPDSVPEVTISIDPQSIDEGESATLSWSASGGKGPLVCEIKELGGSVLSTDPNGNDSVSPDTDTTYVITCEDQDGDSDSASVVLSVDEDEGGDNTPSGPTLLGGGSVLGASFAPKGQVLGASCSLYLLDYLHKDNPNNAPYEVMKLQAFLNTFMNSNLLINGTFDALTFEAVKKFQNLYSNDILKPWVDAGLINSPEATGYVYITTKHKINMMMCPELGLIMPPLVIDTNIYDAI